MSILDSINKAESEADEIREEAKNKARDILLKSQTEARKESDQKINTIKDQNNKKLGELEEKINSKYQGFIEEKRRQNSKIAEKAQNNIPQASSFIVQQVLNQ